MMAPTMGRDSFVVCRNSQGAELRATLLRITRYVVVLEVYNPYSILQLSEVLTEFKIHFNDRLVYSGKAVVSNLVNTGFMLICEATLENEWLDVDLFSPLHRKDKLRGEFGEFLKEWEKLHHVSDDFKVVIADMQTFLMDLRRWLEQVELSIRSNPSGDRLTEERNAFGELEKSVLDPVTDLFGRFEEITAGIPEELQPLHRSYSRRQIHPLVLCSPFVYRSFHKPLGYAGDYEMVGMMLRDPFEGGSLFAKFMNTYFVGAPPCEAHRNRIRHLVKRIGEEVRRVVREGRSAEILDMACGPAQEVQEFLIQDDLCDKADFTLMDFNDETLEYTGRTLEKLRERHGRRTPVRMLKKSVNHILKETFKASDAPPEKAYDFVYCAGLFDYLADSICKRLMDHFYSLLRPGGLLLATNVTPSNPCRNTMECLLEWHLVYRDVAQMAALRPEKAPEKACRVETEVTGINVFLEVRKPL